MPFINRLFKELGYDSAATREGRAEEHHSRRRLSDYSDEEDDSDRNFKHRRPRYSSREDSRHMRHSDDRYSRRRYGDNNNGYGNNNNRYREEGYRNNRDDHHHYSSSSMYQSRHDNRERGRSSRREIGRSGKPLCRDYNGKHHKKKPLRCHSLTRWQQKKDSACEETCALMTMEMTELLWMMDHSTLLSLQ